LLVLQLKQRSNLHYRALLYCLASPDWLASITCSLDTGGVELRIACSQRSKSITKWHQ
jgi:hypothetical protein